MKVKVRDCTVELVFSIWDNEMKVEDVGHIITEAIEKAGLEIVEINHQGEWVNITARKNQG